MPDVYRPPQRRREQQRERQDNRQSRYWQLFNRLSRDVNSFDITKITDELKYWQAMNKMMLTKHIVSNILLDFNDLVTELDREYIDRALQQNMQLELHFLTFNRPKQEEKTSWLSSLWKKLKK